MRIASPAPQISCLIPIFTYSASNNPQFIGQQSTFIAKMSFSQPEEHSCDALEHSTVLRKCSSETAESNAARKKREFCDVLIESQSRAETSPVSFDIDSKSPFPDTRPNLAGGQPEVRRERMIYLLIDERVGIWSDEVSVTTMA
jgi:hypothetical protein